MAIVAQETYRAWKQRLASNLRASQCQTWERLMKSLAMGAILLLATAVSAQQQAHPPYVPPPREVPPPPVTSEPSPGQMPPDSHAPPAAPELASSELKTEMEKKSREARGLAETPHR